MLLRGKEYPSARLLLLALAEHVSEGTVCFPGQSRLAAMRGVSDRQVRSLLLDLAARGLITVEHRPGQGRGRKSNVYRLEMGNRQPASASRGDQPEPGFRMPGRTGRPDDG
jgi:predicted ArsR family transcriptional regulator